MGRKVKQQKSWSLSLPRFVVDIHIANYKSPLLELCLTFQGQILFTVLGTELRALSMLNEESSFCVCCLALSNIALEYSLHWPGTDNPPASAF